MRKLINLFLLPALFVTVLNSVLPTNAMAASGADCLTVKTIRFDRLGYNLDLAPYLSQEQKANKEPALAVIVNWGDKGCSIDTAALKVEQFNFILRISTYKNNVDVPLEGKPTSVLTFDSSKSSTFELTFRIPGIQGGRHQPVLFVEDLKNIPFQEVSLTSSYSFDVASTPTPSPTPSPSSTPSISASSSPYTNLYKQDTAWTVGNKVRVFNCWSGKPKNTKLQVKIKSKWITKVSGKIAVDSQLCGSKTLWATKYVWSIDEFGEIAKSGSSGRYLMVRELVNGTIKTTPISKLVYASNNDRIQDGLNALDDLLGLELR